MTNWKEGKLADVADVLMGQSPKGDTCNQDGTGEPLLNGPTEFTDKYPLAVQYTTDPKRFCEAGDILFCVRGSTTGRMNYADRRYAIGRGLAAIRPKTDRKLIPFVKGLIDRSMGDLLSVASGSVFPNLTGADILSTAIMIPPIEEQRAIAEVLSSLDDKIDLLHRQNKTLESLAQTLFRHWFIEQAKDEWEEGTLADFAYNIRDSIKPSKIAPDTKYVGLEHIERKHLALHAFGTGSDVESNKSVFRKHDILFGKLRPYFHKVCFAPFDGICSTDILVIRPKARNFFAFSLMAFFQKEVVDHSDMASEGTRMPRTNWKILSSYPLPIPDDETMARFNETIQPIIEKIEANISQIASLARTRDDLLPKMMTGEARTTYA